MTRTQILHALDAFLESRPGFEPANYQGAPQAYRADYRRAYQHLQDGRALLRAARRFAAAPAVRAGRSCRKTTQS